MPAQGRHTRRWQFTSRTWLALVVCVNLAPVLSFEYLPSSDGPAHVYNALLIRDMWMGREWTTVARQYVEFAPAIVPNWSGHVLLAGLSLLATPQAAERLLIALWIVLLPCALLYALRAVSPRADALALCAAPWAYASHLHWGFYNFLLALVAFLLAIGYWLRHAERPAPQSTMLLALLAMLTYVSSLIAFAQLLLWLGVLTGLRLLTRQSGALRTAAFSAAALTPAVVAGALFWWSSGDSAGVHYPSARYAAANVFGLDLLNAFHTSAGRIAVAAFGVSLWSAAFLGAVDAVRRRGWSGAPFLLLAGLCSMLVFLAPSSAGGGSLLTPRQVYFVMFALLLWLAGQEVRRGAMRALVGTATALTVSLVVLHWGIYQRYDRAMRTFVDAVASEIPPGARTLLTFPPTRRFVDELPDPAHDVTLSGSAAGYVAARRNLVWFDSYEWHTSHFPLRLRRSSVPGEVTGDSQSPDAVIAWGDGRRRAAAAMAVAYPDRSRQLELVSEFTDPPTEWTLYAIQGHRTD